MTCERTGKDRSHLKCGAVQGQIQLQARKLSGGPSRDREIGATLIKFVSEGRG